MSYGTIKQVSERLCVKLGERADAKEVVAGRDCFGEITDNRHGTGEGTRSMEVPIGSLEYGGRETDLDFDR